MPFHFITSATNNPDYYEFIPIFIKQHKKIYPDCKISILWVSDSDLPQKSNPQEVRDNAEHIVYIKNRPGISERYTAQIMRLLHIASLKTDDICVLSDIDLVLFQPFPFDVDTSYDGVTNWGKMGAAERRASKEMAFCWTFMRPASCRRWLADTPALGVNITMLHKEYYVKMDNVWGYNWTADQQLLYEKFAIHTKFIERDRDDRIDRTCPYIDHILGPRLQYYRDYHMPRPYSKHKKLIEEWLSKY